MIFTVCLILSIACLAVTGLLSVVVVRDLRSERRRRIAAEEYRRSIEPICGCGHHNSYHNDKGCHFVRHPRYENKVRCGCKKYIGPSPLELMP